MKSPRAILFSVLALSSLTTIPSAVTAELTYDGTIIDRPPVFDAYPTHLFIDGIHFMWYCGRSETFSRDAIFVTMKSTNLGPGGWSTPVEVINRSNVPWTEDQVCDPTVVTGPFVYNGTSYEYALHFTANANPSLQLDNAVGAAFSNDGINWTVHPSTVIEPDNGFDGSYGAGEGASAWGTAVGTLHHLYTDTTTGPGPVSVRYKSSSDAVTFSPTPSLATMVQDASPSDQARAPEFAFNPIDGYWYGSTQDVSGGDPNNPIRVIRSSQPNNLFGSWTTIETVDAAQTNDDVNILPGFSRNQNTSLMIDENGESYLFFTTGELLPNFMSWKIEQARFSVTSLRGLVDTFATMSPDRQIDQPLNDTNLEVGMRTWSADPELVLKGGSLGAVGGGGNPVGRVALSTLPADGRATVEARVNPTNANWIGLGFFSSPTTGFALDGQVWMRISTIETLVRADGVNQLLYSGPTPSLAGGPIHVKLQYNREENTVSAWIENDEVLTDFDLDTVSFTPSLTHVGVQAHQPSNPGPVVDDFAVATDPLIFASGFELGGFARWKTEGTIVP